MRKDIMRICAVAMAVTMLGCCFVGCGKNGSGGIGGVGSSQANGLDVSLEHAYKSEKIDTLEMTKADAYVSVGDKILSVGVADYDPILVAYDPATNSSTKLKSDYCDSKPASVTISSARAYWDSGANQLNVIYDGSDNISEDKSEPVVQLEVFDSELKPVENRSIVDEIGKNSSISELTPNPKGGCCAFVSDDSNGTYSFKVFDSSFKKTGDFSTNLSWITSMFTSQGSVYVCSYDNGISVMKLNPDNGATEPVTFNGLSQSAFSFFESQVPEYLFFYSDNKNIYGVNASNQTSEMVINLINSDFFPQDVITNSALSLSDGRFVLSCYQGENYEKTESWLLTERPVEDFKDVRVISLSAIYLDSGLGRAILSFNRTHSDSRIAIVDYSKYVDENNIDFDAAMQAAADKMKDDMLDGKIPDIICMDGVPLASLCNKGVLEDMTEHFSSFSPDTYFTNAIDSMRYNDRLYTIGTKFTLATTVAKTAYVGEKEGVTLDELMKICEGHGDTMKPFGSWTKDMTTTNLIGGMLSSLIDTKTGTCNFNTPEFKKLLGFIKQMPDDFNYEEDAFSQYLDDKSLISSETVYGAKSLYQQIHMWFDDAPVTFLGLPVSGNGGNGARINVSSQVAISSGSTCKEQCYELLDYMLSEEYQKQIGSDEGIPMNRKVFRERSEEEMKPKKVKDANGNLVDESFEVYIRGAMKKVPDMPIEFVDHMEQYILNAKDSASVDYKVMEIIKEETTKFYNGDQDDNTTVTNIQDRVGLYLREQM